MLDALGRRRQRRDRLQACAYGRDELSGWGRLDVAEAIAQATTIPPPPADRFEPNDDAGARACRSRAGAANTVAATIDFWDDQSDVYAVYLRGPAAVCAVLAAPAGTKLFLWRPGREAVEGLLAHEPAARAAASRTGRASSRPWPSRARAGWHYVQVKLARPGAGAYSLGRPVVKLARLQALEARAARRRDVAQAPRGVADDDARGGTSFVDDGAGADEGLLADLDARAEDGAAADARAAADRRAPSTSACRCSVRPM